MSPASNCDRLSDMPDEILHHILSFLPTLESVRTSVLARRWCHLWHCVPTLHFDVDEDLLKQPIVNETEAAYKQAEKINQFFDRRDAAAPLLRFHLHFRYICLTFPFSINPWIRYGRYHDVDINPWIRYARSHDVRDMTVRIDYMTDPPPICMFFDLPSVEALDLRCFCLTDSWALPRRTALSKLKVLSLLISHGAFSSQCLETLLSSCPTLQELTVHYEQCSQDLAITAPNLRRLTIIDSSRYHSCNSYHAQVTCPKLEYLHLTIRMLLKLFKGHLPSLREAFVVFSYSRPMSTEQLEQIFISLGSVTKLTLRLKCYPSCRSEDPRSFPIFHRLKQLKFSAAMGEDYIKQVLLRFVGCSPLLSSLQVIDEQEACDYLLRTEDYDRSIRLVPPIKQPVDHLQTVCVKGISNAETRSDVLKLLSSLVREWARVVVIT